MILAALFILHSATYSIQPIFQSNGQCLGLNDKSQALFWRYDGDPSNLKTFIWENSRLTEVPIPDGFAGIEPSGFNNDGTVIGQVSREADSQGNTEADGFEWNARDGLKNLSVNGQSFAPEAINDRGDIAGTTIVGDDTTPILGVLSKSQKFTPIVSVNEVSASAVALNNKGEIVGMSASGSASSTTAYRILSGAQPETLSIPMNFGNSAGEWVSSLNDGGWATGFIVSKAKPNQGQQDEGAVWSPDNKFYSLGADFRGWGVNNQGQVVGSQITTSGMHVVHDVHAFIYDSAHGVRLLDSLVPAGSPALEKAVAINNKGEIVCRGVDSTQYYLLTPNK